MAFHTTRRKALAAVAGFATVSGCLGLGAEGSEPTYGDRDARWPMLGEDQCNTNSTDTRISAESLRLRRLFRATLDDRYGAPICVDGTVFLSRAGTERHTGGAYALDPRTGRERWYTQDVVDYTTPSVYGETVLFSGNGDTFAVDARTGTVHWRQSVGGSGSHKTHLKRDDTIVVGGGRRVVGLDAYTGDVRWRSPKMGVPSGLASDGERIYVTSGYDGESSLLALDWQSGDVVWDGETKRAAGYPVVADDTVLVMDGGNLRALDATTGSRRWTYGIEPNATAPPAVSPDGDRVFVAGANEPNVHAVSLADGRREWEVRTSSDVQPLVTRDSLVLGLFDHVILVSRSERRVTDTVELPAELTSPFTLGSRGLLFTGQTATQTYYNYSLVSDPDA